jgi:hypothetical protein
MYLVFTVIDVRMVLSKRVLSFVFYYTSAPALRSVSYSNPTKKKWIIRPACESDTHRSLRLIPYLKQYEISKAGQGEDEEVINKGYRGARK